MDFIVVLDRVAGMLQAVRRQTIDLAKQAPDTDDYTMRSLLNVLYQEEKRLRDDRARRIGVVKRPPLVEGKPTNVGDPLPKGPSGGGGPKWRR